jgi:hypothetical protein
MAKAAVWKIRASGGLFSIVVVNGNFPRRDSDATVKNVFSSQSIKLGENISCHLKITPIRHARQIQIKAENFCPENLSNLKSYFSNFDNLMI